MRVFVTAAPVWILVLAAACAACDQVDILGRPYDDARGCWLEREVVGEQRADRSCGTAITLAKAPDGTCYYFTNTCVPGDFDVLSGDADPRCSYDAPRCTECPDAGCPDATD